jgi:hypothetical protein
MLIINGNIHCPVMERSPEDRRDREKFDEAARRYRERVQYLHRIDRRLIMCMLRKPRPDQR